mmetsp:Transcript_44973/g.126981  ORF Transcript_44973/g.126981 Transcript_44973/m.126981 type:complete len:355 (+) Transcript_44973:291-1355(+)
MAEGWEGGETREIARMDQQSSDLCGTVEVAEGLELLIAGYLVQEILERLALPCLGYVVNGLERPRVEPQGVAHTLHLLARTQLLQRLGECLVEWVDDLFEFLDDGCGVDVGEGGENLAAQHLHVLVVGQAHVDEVHQTTRRHRVRVHVQQRRQGCVGRLAHRQTVINLVFERSEVDLADELLIDLGVFKELLHQVLLHLHVAQQRGRRARHAHDIKRLQGRLAHHQLAVRQGPHQLRLQPLQRLDVALLGRREPEGRHCCRAALGVVRVEEGCECGRDGDGVEEEDLPEALSHDGAVALLLTRGVLDQDGQHFVDVRLQVLRQRRLLDALDAVHLTSTTSSSRVASMPPRCLRC